LLLILGLGAGCAPRHYLGPSDLADIRAQDPELHAVRVFVSAKFIAIYERDLGEDYTIDRSQGSVTNTLVARRIEMPIGRNVPGAILVREQRDERTILWITFDPECHERSCAYGFVETDDALYRLFQPPIVEGYGVPFVYRRRISRRTRMKKTKVYARSLSMPVYFRTRGMIASVALELKHQERTEIDTITVDREGVPGELIIEQEAAR